MFSVLLSGAATVAQANVYHRTNVVQSSNFLSFFDFLESAYPTHGFVDFQSEHEAIAKGFVRLGNGQIVCMGADLVNDTAGAPRASVRVQSNKLFTEGIFIIDLEHMPTGCGTWPAFWLCGPKWPAGGEIDILEGSLNDELCQATLRSTSGCNMQACFGQGQERTEGVDRPRARVGAGLGLGMRSAPHPDCAIHTWWIFKRTKMHLLGTMYE